MEFREGGAWRYCLRGPNPGDESCGKAIYQEIKRPEKIVYIDHFTDSEGNINEEMPELTVTIEFIEHEGKTRQRFSIRLRHAKRSRIWVSSRA